MIDTTPYVLLVEDDEDVASLLRHHLEALGHRVVHAESGEAALTHIEDVTPAVLVVDLLPPGLDGREVTRAVHRAQRDSGVRAP
jgi:CheY-like chemotaxis protein